ncbi:MAG: proline dehydrogenase family protein [Planctomycetota bacterium]
MNPLIRLIPPPLVRFFAGPYVAGDSLSKAMGVAARLWAERHLSSTLDLLAEDIDSPELVTQNIQTYRDMIDAVAADERFADGARPTISMKLSSYTTGPLDAGGAAEGSRDAAIALCDYAKKRQVLLTLDMESRHWTDFTLGLLRDLHAAGHTHIGAVLQSRLHRTEKDLDRLPENIRVRLVIGIYKEPKEHGIFDKTEMKARMLTYARTLMARGHFLEFATHDEKWIRRFLSEVVAAEGYGTDRFEVQMLYGVPRAKLLRELTQQGIGCRLYVPFAEGWPMAIAYLRRRLDEFPSMAWLVLKNWFRLG